MRSSVYVTTVPSCTISSRIAQMYLENTDGEFEIPNSNPYKYSNCPACVTKDVYFLEFCSTGTWKNPFPKSSVVKRLFPCSL